MKPKFYHVVGYTQFMGTCKMHIYEDCHQLQKKRVSHHTWGDCIFTGCITATESDFSPRHICKICQRRRTNRPAMQRNQGRDAT